MIQYHIGISLIQKHYKNSNHDVYVPELVPPWDLWVTMWEQLSNVGGSLYRAK